MPTRDLHGTEGIEPPPPLTDDELRRILVHGPRPGTVTLVPCDPAWPSKYAVHRDRIAQALGERALLVEHIGSTAVPGLAAKPIIDLVVGVADPDDESAYLPSLTCAGYELRVREPGHRCLHAVGPDAANLHCYAPGSVEITRYLAFRDRLGSDEGDRHLYEQTKVALAVRRWPDINYYAEAKGPVIRAILGRAGCA